jgi:hypothetical protein
LDCPINDHHLTPPVVAQRALSSEAAELDHDPLLHGRTIEITLRTCLSYV